jgi:hypothetical protein
MGVVFSPRDILKGRRHILEQAVRDIAPSSQAEVLRILDSWEGARSEEALTALIGEEKARILIRLLKP